MDIEYKLIATWENLDNEYISKDLYQIENQIENMYENWNVKKFRIEVKIINEKGGAK